MTSFVMQANWDLYLRLLIALIIGALIGLERASKNKDAGIRTHSLVCLGSSLVMILSGFNSGQYSDPMRLAAQVISGIGFIGAGVIWMDSRNVKRGLTTAASIWVTSALGLVIGYGLFDIALVTFLLMILAINLPKILEKIGIHHHEQPSDDEEIED